MCLWAIYIFPLSACSRIGIPFTGIYTVNRSHKHKCRNWDCSRAFTFLGIFVSNFLYCVFEVHSSCCTYINAFVFCQHVKYHMNAHCLGLVRLYFCNSTYIYLDSQIFFKIDLSVPLKGPNHEKLAAVIFTQIRCIYGYWIGELETSPKTSKINGWGLNLNFYRRHLLAMFLCHQPIQVWIV
jgi:hypothetical protein